MKKTLWLITGGCGFIGTALVKNLLRDPSNVIRIIDDFSGCDLDSKKEFEDFEVIDRPVHLDKNRNQIFMTSVTNGNNVNHAVAECKYVVHLAANTGVQKSLDEPQFDFETNAKGTFNVLEACRKNMVKKFVFASSGAVVGDVNPPINEKALTRPVSPYGASKLTGENYCSAYFHAYGLLSVALRFSNVYGPGSRKKSSVIAKFIKRALNGEELVVNGSGNQTRDFVYIDDLVDAIKKSALSNTHGSQSYQISTGRETSVNELIAILQSTFTRLGIKQIRYVNGVQLKADVSRNFADPSKALTDLGWKAQVDLRDGLISTVKYFLERQNG